jgi:Response regulators consisting of a CheY-like receiver domain and a winged-helix DNA-binding domain
MPGIGEREREGCRRAIGWKRATGPDIMIKQNIPCILVIEKDGQNKRLLQVALKASGFNVLLANTGSEGIAQSKLNTPALIILDIDNVEGDPFALVDQLHRCGKSPVIVLSERGQEHDVVRSLESGADDYIVKPFRLAELIARSRVALRRRAGEEDESPLRLGWLTVDFRARAVWRGGEQVRLTPTEYALLLLFIRNAGKVLTHRYILDQIWGAGCTEESVYLRVYVGHLRKKLGDDPVHPKHILTASKIGYGLAFEPDSMTPG